MGHTMASQNWTGATPTAPRTPPQTPERPQWVPIRSLASRHRPRILAHLLALDGSDRYLRFGHPAADTQIARYVDLIDFERDEVFGIFNRRLELVAMAHLAHEGDRSRPHTAEFGVSVRPSHRGRGFGARLFEHAMLHARNRQVDTLIIHALSENRPMLNIARNAGATVQREGGEAEAVLKLPPETLGSQVEEMFGRQAAEFDYSLKRSARRLDGLLDMIADVRAGVGGSGGLGSQ